MQEACKNTKKSMLLFGSVSLLIAALLDIKYKGLLYQVIKKVSCTCTK